MAEPREGTILSVIQAFAEEMQAQAGAGARDLRACFRPALERAREALRRTTDQLKVLRSAGVVDAGALGFVDLLEGMASNSSNAGAAGWNDELPEEFLVAGVDAPPGARMTPAIATAPNAWSAPGSWIAGL